MGHQQDQENLKSELDKLKEFLHGQDLAAITDEEEIYSILGRVADVYIQVKQYISKHGSQAWRPWGYSLWSQIERNEQGLKRKLETMERASSLKSDKFSRNMAIISGGCAVISTIAAVITLIASN